jgi:hypothetical protein
MSEKNEELKGGDVQEIIKEGEKIFKEKINKAQWGNWRFSRSNNLLIIRKSRDPGERERDLYEIALEQCNSSAEILDWIGQLDGKNWTTAEDMGYLVEALDDLLSLQSNFCSGGEEQSDGKPNYAKRILEQLFKSLEE